MDRNYERMSRFMPLLDLRIVGRGDKIIKNLSEKIVESKFYKLYTMKIK